MERNYYQEFLDYLKERAKYLKLDYTADENHPNPLLAYAATIALEEIRLEDVRDTEIDNLKLEIEELKSEINNLQTQLFLHNGV